MIHTSTVQVASISIPGTSPIDMSSVKIVGGVSGIIVAADGLSATLSSDISWLVSSGAVTISVNDNVPTQSLSITYTIEDINGLASQPATITWQITATQAPLLITTVDDARHFTVNGGNQ